MAAIDLTAPRRRVFAGPVAHALLIGLAVTLSVLVIGLPVVAVFGMALSSGASVYMAAILQPATLYAIWLTVLTALIVVPINIGFGIAAAWAITRFTFPGKKLMTTLIEIPFSISPIVAGTAYLFLYGAQGLFGPWLAASGIQIMFTVFAIFLVSLFVTSPFVARELITVMQSQGVEDEEAGVSLGASGYMLFWKVTLPNIKWALLYGAVLCNARVMGEFGAVSVVSGSIRGETNTLPLQIELLFQDQNTAGAFAAASTLTVIALITLFIKLWAERRRDSHERL
ncbi:sulfate ABC transporter permease subunit CysW [Oceanibaculum pacificum]|uniref:Sulfate ABC transporter permease n=1 Tax=Oceanibaculum pacificum TaxID=580166 RepID=A0A154W1R0_9PROT|nr:sulfate ABC transporter permease subunit CysW [Oceanibaculum pacificum]KZD07397.1 sulfate ABC transporter permease [Oceanibaculum pacificum]